MNDKIKNYLLFFICLPIGISIFLVNYYTNGKEYEIYTLDTFLTMLSITIIIIGFVYLFKNEKKVPKPIKNQNEYIELINKEKQDNIEGKRKSIIYYAIGTIIFLISAIFSFQDILLKISNLLIILFFVLGIIKFDYSIEKKIREIFEDKNEYVKSVIGKDKKTKKVKLKKPLLYIIFDIIPEDLMIPGVILIHSLLGILLREIGLFDILPYADEYYDIYESGYLFLSFIPAFVLTKKYHDYYK